jgi:hypothetical protein
LYIPSTAFAPLSGIRERGIDVAGLVDGDQPTFTLPAAFRGWRTGRGVAEEFLDKLPQAYTAELYQAKCEAIYRHAEN